MGHDADHCKGKGPKAGNTSVGCGRSLSRAPTKNPKWWHPKTTDGGKSRDKSVVNVMNQHQLHGRDELAEQKVKRKRQLKGDEVADANVEKTEVKESTIAIAAAVNCEENQLNLDTNCVAVDVQAAQTSNHQLPCPETMISEQFVNISEKQSVGNKKHTIMIDEGPSRRRNQPTLTVHVSSSKCPEMRAPDKKKEKK